MYPYFLASLYSLIITLLSEFVIIIGISIKYLLGIYYYYNNLSSTFLFLFFCIIIKRKYKPMLLFLFTPNEDNTFRRTNTLFTKLVTDRIRRFYVRLLCKSFSIA